MGKGTVKLDSLAEYEATEKEYHDTIKEMNIIDEEIIALNDKKSRLKKDRDKLDKNRYNTALKVVNEHKFWTLDKKFSAVAKVDKIETEYYVKFLVTSEKGVDRQYSSSAAGVLINYPIPITEEKYNEIYTQYKGN